MIRKLFYAFASLAALVVFLSNSGHPGYAQVPPTGSTQSLPSPAPTPYTWKLTPGQSTCLYQVTGTWTGTLTFTISNDGTNFVASPQDATSTLAANGLLFQTCASARYTQVSANLSAGTAVVTMIGTGASFNKSAITGAVTVQTPLPVTASTTLPVSIGTTVPVSIATAAVPVSLTAFTHYAALAAATTGPTAAAATAGPGTLGTVVLANSSAAVAYVQIFDLATGSVTLGTTKPDRVLGCAAATTCYLQNTAPGTAFTTAISFVCCTTTPTGATGTNVATIYFMLDHK